MSRPSKRPRREEPKVTRTLSNLPSSLGASVAQWLDPKEAHAYSLSTKSSGRALQRHGPLVCGAWTRDGAGCYRDAWVTSQCEQYCALACRRLVTELLEQVNGLDPHEEGTGTLVHLQFPATLRTHAVPWHFSYTQSLRSHPEQRDDLDYAFTHRHTWEYGAHWSEPGYAAGAKAVAPIADRVCRSLRGGRGYRLRLMLELRGDVPEERAAQAKLREELETDSSRRVAFSWADPERSALNSLRWTLEAARRTETPAFELIGTSP